MMYNQPEQRPPALNLDSFLFVVAVSRHDGLPQFFIRDGVTTCEVMRALEQIHAYLSETTRPQPAREKPSSHYPYATPEPPPVTATTGD